MKDFLISFFLKFPLFLVLFSGLELGFKVENGFLRCLFALMILFCYDQGRNLDHNLRVKLEEEKETNLDK